MIDAMTKHLITVALAGVAAVVAAFGGSPPGDDVTRVAPLASADGGTALQQDLVSIVRAVSPSVVQIRTPQDLGSGVVFDARGDVVTNAHVVGKAKRFVVTLASGDSHPATAIGRDAANDLAVIRVAGARPRPATFADSSQVEVGDIALALGNPLGLRSTVTEGIVSALRRKVPEGDGAVLSSAIQTSAAINPATRAARSSTSPVA
jgi:putative serine protease PepD